MKRRKALFGFGLLTLLVFQACGVKLHQHYSNTQVKKDTDIYVTNDSAMVSLKATGNIDFVTDISEAKRFLKKEWDLKVPDGILFIGKSNVAPFYSFILLQDNGEGMHHPQFNGIKILSFQRQIGDHKFNLIARSQEPNLRPDDFEFILNNLKVK